MRRAELPDVTSPGLTARQRTIIRAIEDSMQRHGYAPTMREIGDAAGLASTSSVSYQLAMFGEEGIPEPRCGAAADGRGAAAS